MYCIDAVHIHTEYIIRAIYLYTSRVLSMKTYGVPHQAANWKPANLRFQRPATQNEYGKFKYTCHRPLLHQCLVGTKLAHWYCSRISQITGQQPAQMPLRKQRKRINRCVFFLWRIHENGGMQCAFYLQQKNVFGLIFGLVVSTEGCFNLVVSDWNSMGGFPKAWFLVGFGDRG